MDDDFCGLPLNVGIGSRYPLSADTNFTTDSYLGTSLAVIFHQGKTIAMMGTSDGSLMKVIHRISEFLAAVGITGICQCFTGTPHIYQSTIRILGIC